jgi:cytochrome c-type biogenesis protein CcmE
MNNRTVLNDPLVLGRLVRVWGKVKDISSSGAVTFRISDGYNADVVVTADNVVLPEGFGIGKMVIVTGILDADRKVIARKVVVM